MIIKNKVNVVMITDEVIESFWGVFGFMETIVDFY